MKLFLLGCVQAFSVRDQYAQFLKTFGRDWTERGLKVFSDNLERVNQTNPELSPFLDLSPVDFRAQYLSSRPVNVDFVESHVGTEQQTPIPPSVDWRTKGVVPQVWTQGQMEDVVPYVAADNLASASALILPPLISATAIANVRKMISVCSKCPFPELDFACAFGYAVNTSGVCTTFSGNCNCARDLRYSRFISLRDESNLLNAVAQGPVSAWVNAAPWQLYQGGIFAQGCNQDVDHAVLVVGYGSDGGLDYWILKNSWGTKWGEFGYIRLKRGKSGVGQCGVAVGDFYPVGRG